ncbi:DUF2786 domain-containing protein [Pseudacidovorax intermedius]|uniref:DUF2786 domain-containing protein n=1 Tax=Pseudacidovorax intermedius TaxID=433924 RepID=UPI0026F2E393|nr:DUF2786 domain-containing protein [Pseudacidovorax intermedius]
MTPDQALAKIKKCLAVARGNSPEEAAVALNQARKLMALHGLTERDVSLADVNEVKVKAASKSATAWESRLARMVAEAFGCELFFEVAGSYKAGNYVRTRHVVFVGLNASPTLAGYAHEVLSRQCARDRMAHIGKQPRNCKPITKTTRGDEFARGWVYRVSDKLDAFAQPEKNEQLLLDYLEAKHPDLAPEKVRKRKAKRNTDAGHFLAGASAAESAQLNRGVGAFAPKGLIE